MCQPLKSSIDKPADVKSRIGILNTNDQMKLEKYLINDINETAIGILLSLHAGLRIGEVRALTWSDIDLNTIESVARIASALEVSLSKLFEKIDVNISSNSIPLTCYDLISSKSLRDQEQLLKILLEVDKYKTN